MDCSPPGSSVNGDSAGKNTGMGCHALLWWIFPTVGSNPGLPHGRWILYRLSYKGSRLSYHLSHKGSPVSLDIAKCFLSSETAQLRSMVIGCGRSSGGCFREECSTLTLPTSLCPLPTVKSCSGPSGQTKASSLLWGE